MDFNQNNSQNQFNNGQFQGQPQGYQQDFNQGYNQNFNQQYSMGLTEPPKKNKGRTIGIVFAIIGLLLLCCCGFVFAFGKVTFDTVSSSVNEMQEYEEEHVDDEFGTSTPSVDVDSENQTPAANPVVGDASSVHDFSNMHFTLDGVTLTMPITGNDIEALGYEYRQASYNESSLDDMLEAGEDTFDYFIFEASDDRSFFVDFINLSDVALPIRDCQVRTIYFYDYSEYGGATPEFNIDNVITMGMTLEEFDKLFPNVTSKSDSVSDGQTYSERIIGETDETYYFYNEYSYYFSDGILNEVDLRYID